MQFKLWRWTLVLTIYAGSIPAQVTMDGTLGRAGALPGPNYAITADLGQQVGGNLFHSFGTFSIPTGASATFSGPASVNNIIGRVTGGQVSQIDGTLRSTISGASLYLLNPAGVLFGENARLDVSGSVHVSTADTLRLRDGGQFPCKVGSVAQARAHPLPRKGRRLVRCIPGQQDAALAPLRGNACAECVNRLALKLHRTIDVPRCQQGLD